jgi:DNA-binding response OmpR family regulator
MSTRHSTALALIIDPDQVSIHILRDHLRLTWGYEVHWSNTEDQAWALCKSMSPTVIFVDLKSPEIDGLRFTRELRRSYLCCRHTPVIVSSWAPKASEALAARDVGAHEFMRKPFSLKQVSQRIEAVTRRKRDWIEGVGYVGPDRRWFNSGQHHGARRRRTDQQSSPEKVRIAQALKIMKVALESIESDPRQAFRAIRAQAENLQNAAVEAADYSLANAAKALKDHLDNAAQNRGFACREFVEGIDGVFNASRTSAPPKKRSIVWID